MNLQMEILLPDRVEIAVDSFSPFLCLSNLDSDIRVTGTRLILCLQALGANNCSRAWRGTARVPTRTRHTRGTRSGENRERGESVPQPRRPPQRAPRARWQSHRGRSRFAGRGAGAGLEHAASLCKGTATRSPRTRCQAQPVPTRDADLGRPFGGPVQDTLLHCLHLLRVRGLGDPKHLLDQLKYLRLVALPDLHAVLEHHDDILGPVLCSMLGALLCRPWERTAMGETTRAGGMQERAESSPSPPLKYE